MAETGRTKRCGTTMQCLAQTMTISILRLLVLEARKAERREAGALKEKREARDKTCRRYYFRHHE